MICAAALAGCLTLWGTDLVDQITPYARERILIAYDESRALGLPAKVARHRAMLAGDQLAFEFLLTDIGSGGGHRSLPNRSGSHPVFPKVVSERAVQELLRRRAAERSQARSDAPPEDVRPSGPPEGAPEHTVSLKHAVGQAWRESWREDRSDTKRLGFVRAKMREQAGRLLTDGEITGIVRELWVQGGRTIEEIRQAKERIEAASP